jgi:hypothetical protein
MRILGFFAGAILAGALLSGSVAAQTSYPLQCRAGGNMNVNIAGQTTGGGTEIVIGGFDRAATTTSLPAGSCAWLDRPMNTREPRAMRLVVRARMSVDFRPRAGDHGGDRADAFVSDGSGADVEYTRTILRVLDAGGYFRVQAYNPGRSLLVASSFAETGPR